MKIIFTFFCLICINLSFAQVTADFENFDLPSESFLNNAADGVFSSGPVFLPNDYNAEFDFWGGWSISTTTNANTPGIQNQYSAITGAGFNGSATYAVTYAFSAQIIGLNEDFRGGVVEGMYVTNSTYAALSMQNGDAFSKQFGGVSGNDPDFFLLTIRGYLDGILSDTSVQFYLADYTFSDNSQDYIIDEWTFLDLSALGPVDSLSCSLSSSDVGDFGMNTPAYFCIDNVIVSQPVSASFESIGFEIEVFPNPATDFLRVRYDIKESATFSLIDLSGRIALDGILMESDSRLELRGIQSGVYILQLNTANGTASKKVIVH
jgi:hypothetical protein